MTGQFHVPTRFGDKYIPTSMFVPVLGTSVGRVYASRRKMTESGFYNRPFLVRNREQELYARLPGPYSALRAVLYSKHFEGAEGDVSEGDRQKLLSFMADHHTLLGSLAEGALSTLQRNRFVRFCERLAKRMNRPVNEIKRDILFLTLEVSRTAEDERRVQMLGDAIGLDQKRLDQIDGIVKNLNWRAVAIVSEITRQQSVISDAQRRMTDLRLRMQNDAASFAARAMCLDELVVVREHMRTVYDRPFVGIASRTACDIDVVTSIGAVGSKGVAQTLAVLDRALLGAEVFAIARDINVAFYLLAMARTTRGAVKDHRLTGVRATLESILSKVGDPARGDVLSVNPLWGVYGRVHDALEIWSDDPKVLDEVHELLNSALDRF